jgi:nicotinate dehydrogenase subunit A
MAVAFELNGAQVSVDAPGDTPLLYGLRDNLRHKGTRFGCGAGQCGACTVIVDGRALQSCDTPLWSVAGRRVVTAEGLPADRVGAAVREAFIELQAAQCGFCINGVMLSVTALLSREPRPSREAIAAALERNLCRCGTHVRILRAIERAVRRLAGATP